MRRYFFRNFVVPGFLSPLLSTVLLNVSKCLRTEKETTPDVIPCLSVQPRFASFKIASQVSRRAKCYMIQFKNVAQDVRNF
jgi:hypothetical protein